MKWNIVNVQFNKENQTLLDGQICADLSVGSPAINFWGSDVKLLIDLLSDANAEEHAQQLISSLKAGN